MSKVGIIANPSSGKDIRRIVSHATLISNIEKANIIRRLIVGIDSTEVDEILIMPDYDGLGAMAIEALNHQSLSSKIRILEFQIQGNQNDSISAAKIMRENKVACIITLGGDGTNRVVSKTIGQIPLIHISTGTNNVFSSLMEGTTAGMAAGILANKVVEENKVTAAMKKIKLFSGKEETDIALIDLVVVTESFIGAKAIWDAKKIKQVVLTFAEPDAVGFSSIEAARVYLFILFPIIDKFP